VLSLDSSITPVSSHICHDQGIYPTRTMSRHARIEEVSDSDSEPSEMDPSDFDPGLMQSIIQPANIPSTAPQQSQQQQPVLQPHFPGRPPPDQNAELERTKHYQCLFCVKYLESDNAYSFHSCPKKVCNPPKFALLYAK